MSKSDYPCHFKLCAIIFVLIKLQKPRIFACFKVEGDFEIRQRFRPASETKMLTEGQGLDGWTVEGEGKEMEEGHHKTKRWVEKDPETNQTFRRTQQVLHTGD